MHVKLLAQCSTLCEMPLELSLFIIYCKKCVAICRVWNTFSFVKAAHCVDCWLAR